jgi:hypothetical protein
MEKRSSGRDRYLVGWVHSIQPHALKAVQSCAFIAFCRHNTSFAA